MPLPSFRLTTLLDGYFYIKRGATASTTTVDNFTNCQSDYSYHRNTCHYKEYDHLQQRLPLHPPQQRHLDRQTIKSSPLGGILSVELTSQRDSKYNYAKKSSFSQWRRKPSPTSTQHSASSRTPSQRLSRNIYLLTCQARSIPVTWFVINKPRHAVCLVSIAAYIIKTKLNRGFDFSIWHSSVEDSGRKGLIAPHLVL